MIKDKNVEMYANYFGMFPDQTILNYLLYWDYDPEEYFNLLDNIETAIKEKEYLAQHPEEANEEAQYLDDDIADWEEKVRSMIADWKPEEEPDMEKELELIKKWVDDIKHLHTENLEEFFSDICDNYCKYLNDIPSDVWDNIGEVICSDCPVVKLQLLINNKLNLEKNS